MPNTYFQFKQFRIEQGQTAMKVTTEGCLFGALIEPVGSPERILDVGAGTGLLSLMLAQRFPRAVIDGVEIEAEAFKQCGQNFLTSPWADRLFAHHRAIQDFSGSNSYDVIVSNPPFFKGSLNGRMKKDLLAKHELGLGQADLLENISRLLSDDGVFWVLYPEREADQFQVLAEMSGLYPWREWVVRNQSNGPVFRVIRAYTKKKLLCESKELELKTGNIYTPEFVSLLRDYYLGL